MKGCAWSSVTVAALSALLLALPAGAGAAKIKVTTGDDGFGAGDRCALREAVQAANTNADFGGCVRQGTGTADKIVLRGGRTHTTTIGGANDDNTGGDLDVAGETRIKVNGTGKAKLDGNFIDRVLEVLPGASLQASRLVIRNGFAAVPHATNSGGGINNRGRLELSASKLAGNDVPTNLGCICGGGLANSGTARLNEVVIQGNHADINFGGGIAHTSGRLVVKRSTIAGNSASTGAGIGLNSDDGDVVKILSSTIAGNQAGQGGGISSSSFGDHVQRLTNVTISGNESTSRGGGIFVFSGKLNMNAVTITDNTGDSDGDGGGTVGGSGGGVYGNASVKAKNSIIAGNSVTNAGSEDCFGTSVPFKRSVVGMGTGCIAGQGSVAAANPRLRPLGDYGGPTETHALRPASPAIGLAGPNSAPKRDQRGAKRDNNPDAGAFER